MDNKKELKAKSEIYGTRFNETGTIKPPTTKSGMFYTRFNPEELENLPNFEFEGIYKNVKQTGEKKGGV